MTLADQILFIARTGKTGTLQVLSRTGACKGFCFVEGFLAEIDSGREDTVLETALRNTDLFSEKDLKKARKLASRGGLTLGAALLELDVVPEEEVEFRLRDQIVCELAEALSWNEVEEMQFVEHTAEERLDDFQCELSDYYEIYTDVEEVFIEGAGRRADWETIEEHFPILRDVFYATPSSIRYFTAQDEHPYEHAIVSTVDSSRSLQEVLDEAGLDRFAGLNAARRLITERDLQMIDPVQMYQIGLGFVEKEQYEKAYRTFHRALEKGLREFDLELKIADLLNKMGRREEAVAHYMRFSQKCMTEDRLDEALRTLRDVRQLEPESTVISERLIEIFLRQSRVEDATQEAMRLATRKAAGGAVPEALGLLERVRERNPSDAELQRKIAELAGASGDKERAHREREKVEKNDSLQQDDASALETYQKMFVDGQDTLDVRLKLVELHRKCGSKSKAIDHATAILNLSDKRRIRDEKTLLHLHQSICDLKPSDLRSNRWLIEHYLEKQQTEKAVEQLQSWIAHLEREEDYKEASLAYEKLISVDDQLQHRWGHAGTLEKLARPKRVLEALRNLCDAALERREYEQAARALEAIRKSWPLDMESRRRGVELAVTTGQTERALQQTRELVRLAILAGDVQVAEEYVAKLEGDTSATGHVVRDLGRLDLESGRTEKAIERFLGAARIFAARGDRGSLSEVTAEIFALEPQHPEATAIVQGLAAAAPAAEAVVTTPPARAIASGPPSATAAAQGGPAARGPAAREPAAREPAAPPTAPATAAAETPPRPAAPVETPAAASVAGGAIAREVAEPTPAAGATGDATATESEEKRVDAAGRPLPAEPFQAPAPVKTSVSNITARLRRLQTGGGGATRNKVTKVSSNLAKLKAMRSPEAGAQPGASASDPKPPIARDGDDASPPATSPAQAGEALPSSEGGGTRAVSNAKLGSAASRLRALSGKEATAPAPPAPAGRAAPEAASTPAEDSSDATPRVLPLGPGGPSGEEIPASEGGGTRAVSKAKLGSAASRLRALSGKTDAGPAITTSPEKARAAPPAENAVSEQSDTPVIGAPAAPGWLSTEEIPASAGGGQRAVAKVQLDSAAARLRALAAEPSAGGSPGTPRAGQKPASPDDDTGTILPAVPDTRAVSSEEGGGTIATKKQPLAGPASRLAALRTQVAEREHEPQT